MGTLAIARIRDFPVYKEPEPQVLRVVTDRVAEAKRYLGKNWIGHPDYTFNPRHSNNPEIYIPARAPYMLAISIAARADRENNPAFMRQQAINKVMA